MSIWRGPYVLGEKLLPRAARKKQATGPEAARTEGTGWTNTYRTAPTTEETESPNHSKSTYPEPVSEQVNMQNPSGAKGQAELAGLLHDLGKYADQFSVDWLTLGTILGETTGLPVQLV